LTNNSIPGHGFSREISFDVAGGRVNGKA